VRERGSGGRLERRIYFFHSKLKAREERAALSPLVLISSSNSDSSSSSIGRQGRD
jgi:hypothetical protein